MEMFARFKRRRHSSCGLSCGEKKRPCRNRSPEKKRPCRKRSPEKTGVVQIRDALANVQRKTGCTTRTLHVFMDEMRQFLKCDYPLKELLRRPDCAAERRKFKNSGSICLRLHGCVGCNAHVFRPKDKDKRCPGCGHPRFNVYGRPNEVRNIPI